MSVGVGHGTEYAEKGGVKRKIGNVKRRIEMAVPAELAAAGVAIAALMRWLGS